MTNEINEKLEELLKALYENEIVKNYFKYKDAIKDDKSLLEVNEQMRKHQKLMVESINEPETHKQEKDLYLKFKNEYESHPLVVNYEYYKEETYNLLKQISNILNN